MTKCELRKLKKNLFWTCVPIYGSQVFISVDGVGPVKKYFGETMGLYEEGVCGEVMQIENDGGAVGLIISLVDHDMNTVSHECVHAAWRTLQTHGVWVEEDNHEALAYLVGYFVDLCVEAIDRKEPKKNVNSE